MCQVGCINSLIEPHAAHRLDMADLVSSSKIRKIKLFLGPLSLDSNEVSSNMK